MPIEYISTVKIMWQKIFSGALARSTLKTSGMLVARIAAQALFLLVTAWMLGAELFGVFSGIASLAVLLGLFPLGGMHLVLLEKTSIAFKERNAILSYALPTSLLIGSLILIPYLWIALPLSQQTSLHTSLVVSIGVSELLLQPIIILAHIEKLADEKVALSQFLTVLPLALKAVFVAIISFFPPPIQLTMFAVAYLASTLLTLSFIFTSMKQPWPSIRQWRLPNWAEINHSAGFAFLSFGTLGVSEVDKIVALKLLPNHITGVYTVSARIIGALITPISALMLSTLPRLFRYNARQAHSAVRLTKWIFCISISYGLLASIALWASAPLLVHLFDASYINMERMLRMLALTVPFLSLRIAACTELMTLGKPFVRTSVELSGMALLILIALWRASDSPFTSMPTAILCSECWMSLCAWWLIWRFRRTPR
jgi:O-antigen/teichoic acid export membrane protein